MDKLAKSLETLKTQAVAAVDEKLRKKDATPTAKDKIAACQALAESLNQNAVKQHSDYGKQFSSAVEALFVFCEDSNADVRLVVEECLNSVFRNLLTEGSATRVHVELYREIKRNGPSRCVRAALLRFAILSPLIRPNKSRLFAMSLVPCFTTIAKRPQEAVQDCLGSVAPKVFSVLGRFLSDEEAKLLVKSVLPNLQLQSAVSRRTASAILVNVCKYSRKRHLFTAYLFKSVLVTLVPVQLDQTTSQTLGSLLVLRQLIPLITECCDGPAPEPRTKRTDRGNSIRITQQIGQITLEQMVQLYEVLLYHLSSSQSTILAATLETLIQLLFTPPIMLLNCILSDDGIGESKLFSHTYYNTLGRRSRTSSFTSGMSSLAGSQSDLQTLSSFGDLQSLQDPSPLFVSPEVTDQSSESAQSPVNQVLTSPETEAYETASDDESRVRTYTGIEIGTIVEDNQTESSSGFVEVEDHPLQPSLSLNQLEPIDECEISKSETDTPLLSPIGTNEMLLPEGIGSFVDADQSVKYCARLVAARFLLCGQAGETISDREVRVSHKTLALNCIIGLVAIEANVLDLYLYIDSQSCDTLQPLADVLLFMDHSDPQLRACTATLCGTWINSKFSKNGHKWTSTDYHRVLCVIEVLERALTDPSSVVSKSAIESFKKCWEALIRLKDGDKALDFLDCAINLAKNPYWLLKVSVAEFLSDLSFAQVLAVEGYVRKTQVLQEKSLQSFLLLLRDDDSRVRSSTANALSKLINNLCYHISPSHIDFIRSQNGFINLDTNLWIHKGFPQLHSLAEPYCISASKRNNQFDTNLSKMVSTLVTSLTVVDSREHMAGCISGLCQLIQLYPPTIHRSAWLISNSHLDMTTVGLLNLLYQLMYGSSLSSDIYAYQQILTLIGYLFAGHAQAVFSRSSHDSNQSKSKWSNLGNSQLAAVAKDVLHHCMKILNIYWHILTEQSVPSAAVSALSKQISQLPQRPSLSPVKTKITETVNAASGKKDTNSNNTTVPSLTTSKVKHGDFSNSSALSRLYDLLKGSYFNYKTNLEEDLTERFTGLLRQTLICLGQILEMATVHEVGIHAEEFLIYFKYTINILPEHTVLTVTQLLKALFGTNFVTMGKELKDESRTILTQSLDVFQQHMNIHSGAISQRLLFMTHSDTMEFMIKRHLGWINSRSEKYMGNLFKNSATKAALTNYIRMFEPIVLQSLKLYTSSVGLNVQRAVLALLTQLVQDRVNYSLLDAENRFLNFLFQQLESIEEGNFRNAEDLVPTLFEFLLMLSYEKTNNKQIVEMPKILQLCDSLMASGLDLAKIVMPAVHLVVLDLYFVRPVAKLEPPKEIQMQQEVIASMLLKHLQYPEAVDLLTFILWQLKKESDQKWRKLSRDIVDRLLPVLASGQLELHSGWSTLNPYFTVLQLVCSSAVRPADHLLNTLFQIWSVNEIGLDRRLSCLSGVCLCLWMLSLHCKEDAVLDRLEELSSQCQDIRFSRFSSSDTKQNQFLLAGLFVDILERCTTWLITAKTTSDVMWRHLTDYSGSFLVWNLNWLINLVQYQGPYRKTSAALAVLFQTKDHQQLFEQLLYLRPDAAIQWCTLLSTVKAFDADQWEMVHSWHEPVPRKIALVLYADHVITGLEQKSSFVETFLDRFMSDLVDLCNEPKIAELFRLILYGSNFAPNVLNLIGQELKQETKVSRARKLLHLLSISDVQYSGVVLPILVNTLSSSLPVLARMAGQVACRKLELLLVNRSQEIIDMIPCDLVLNLVSSFNTLLKDRFAQLYSLLLKLSDSWYPDVALNDSYIDKEIYELIPSGSPTKFNRLKFVRMVQNGIKSGGIYSPEAVVKTILVCSHEEMVEILTAEDIQPEHLYACLKQSVLECFYEEPNDESPEKDENRPLFCATRIALMGNLNKYVISWNKEPIVSLNSSEMTRVFGLCRCIGLFFDLITVHNIEQPLNDTELHASARFALTSIQLLLCSPKRPICQSLHVLQMIKSLLSHQAVTDWLARVGGDDILNLQLDFLKATFLVCVQYFNNKEIDTLFRSLKVPFTPPADIPSAQIEPFVEAWKKVNALLCWLEKMNNNDKNDIATTQWKAIKGVILTVARLPAISSFVRVPLAAFQFGWSPEAKWDVLTVSGMCGLVLPTTPVHQLQNVDVLKQFVWRLCSIGWISRQQFEEVWMALLGVLSATPVSQELQANSSSEITERIVASSLAVRCLTALLLQSLLSPQPGNPLSSCYMIKHREKRSSFLSTKYGHRLVHLKQKIAKTQLRSDHFLQISKSSLFGRNPDRIRVVGGWGFGQFSIETLWSLTGILAAERNLLLSKPDNSSEEQTEEQGNSQSVFYSEEPPPGETIESGLVKSASNFVLSANSSLDLVSCLHFLLDLYSHWLRDGCDAVPLPLLSATIESMIVLSDLFTERGQFEWLRSQLRSVLLNRMFEDDLLLQYLLFGLLKCTAVLGIDDYEIEKETELQYLLNQIIKTNGGHPQLSVRLFTVHGLLYLLQALSADESLPLMPIITEFVAKELDDSLSYTDSTSIPSRPQNLSYQLSLWTLGFHVAESNQDPYSRQNFVPRFFEQCQRAFISLPLGIAQWEAVLCGLESLLLTSSVDMQKRRQLSKLASTCIQRPLTQQHTVLALQLLLTCLYTGKEGESSRQMEVGHVEPQLSAMEQLTHLFNKVSNGSYSESSAVGQALPWFLVDNFSPGDVMNRVVSELLAPTQSHPRALLVVVKQLFDALWEREAPLVVCDWSLLSVPTFTHKTPVHFAIWSLTCFLVCSAANTWIKNLFPLLLDRMYKFEEFDSELFVFILQNLENQFEEKTQAESLILSLEDAAKRHPQSAFARAVETIKKEEKG